MNAAAPVAATFDQVAQRLLHRYFRFIDHGEAAKVASLFTVDGVFKLGRGELVGRDKIESAFRRRQDQVGRTSRHVLTNVLVDQAGADGGSAAGYVVVYRHDAGVEGPPFETPVSVGDVIATFSRRDVDWQIATLELSDALATTTP